MGDVSAPVATTDGDRPEPVWIRPARFVLLGGTLVVAVVLRFLTTSDLWLDEALTVNIADLPLGELRGALLRDGAPPLYYVLLHGWMAVFGTSDVAVRALSGVLGVLALFLTWRAGTELARTDPVERRWSGWAALLVMASSPYAIRYSTEARMYMLAMVLVLVGYLAVMRVTRDGATPLRFLTVALATAALLYTQYWSFFLLAVVGAVMAFRAVRAPDPERRPARAILGAMVVGGLAFLPWVPTFLSQMAHTGTPWDTPVTPPTAIGLGFLDFVGGKTFEGWSLILVVVVLALLALVARARGQWTLDIDLRTVPGVRWEWGVGAATLAVGLAASYATGTGFQSRYAAVMFPFVALAVAFGVLAFADLRVRVGLLAFLVVFGFVGGARNAVTNRTQASQVVDVIAAESRPGDVVVTCPDQLGPDTHRLIRDDLGVVEVAYPTFDGPEFVDWVDYADRNAKADPAAFAERVLAEADGRTIWMIWSPGYRTFEGQCEALVNALSASRGISAARVTADDGIYEFMGLHQFPAADR